jgi:hypothetical protein
MDVLLRSYLNPIFTFVCLFLQEPHYIFGHQQSILSGQINDAAQCEKPYSGVMWSSLNIAVVWWNGCPHFEIPAACLFPYIRKPTAQNNIILSRKLPTPSALYFYFSFPFFFPWLLFYICTPPFYAAEAPAVSRLHYTLHAGVRDIAATVRRNRVFRGSVSHSLQSTAW